MQDIQKNEPSNRITIDKVGIKGYVLPLNLGLVNGQTVGLINLYVNLSANERGTHMSRLIEALNEWDKEISTVSIRSLLQKVSSQLYCTRCFLEVSFPVFYTKLSPVTKKAGLMKQDVSLSFRYNFADDNLTVTHVFRFALSTVCPCSKAISHYGAHNQRGILTIEFTQSELCDINTFIFDIEHVDGIVQVYPLLKREDEKCVTEMGYDNPAFVEDIVRIIARYLSDVYGIKNYSVQSENFESIHAHNAYALISSTSD